MSRDQHEHYIVAKVAEREMRANRVEALVKRFRYLEDLLLLWSIPALIGSLLLSAMSSAVGGSVPFIAFVLSLLVTLITLVVACILFLKWIDTLQHHGRSFARTIDDESTLRFMGASAVSVVLLILIVATATSGDSGPQIVLQILVFILLGWHYRALLKRFS